MSSCTHSDEGPSPETETVFPRHKICCSSSRRRFLHSLLYHVVIESDQVPSPFYSLALHNLIPTPSRLPPPRHISLLGKPHQHHTHSSCHWVHILGMYKLLSGQINTTHPPLPLLTSPSHHLCPDLAPCPLPAQCPYNVGSLSKVNVSVR